MNCCVRDDCYHSYHHHHPGTELTVSSFRTRAKLGRCRISTCRCRGYVKGSIKLRPKRIPELCPRCKQGDHEFHHGRKCLSWTAPHPHNWVCLCGVDRDSVAPPVVEPFNAPVRLGLTEVAEIVDAEGVAL